MSARSIRPINAVYWAVPPGHRGTRPLELLEALAKVGVVSESLQRYYHGIAKPVSGWHASGRFFPDSSAPGPGAACFSPVFGPGVQSGAFWFDAYDDWSIAPDINPWHRGRARATYSTIRTSETRNLVTCNSPYMARKLGVSLDAVVPNGAQSRLAKLSLIGTDRRRLIVQGHFFRGRTDFRLLLDVAESGAFDEVLICAPGRSSEMQKVLDTLRGRRELDVIVQPWLSDDDLASHVGHNTVALVPHVVSDYTLSQDLMKVYKFLMLGMRVICPRMLWPDHLSPDFAFLVDFGVQPRRDIPDWLIHTRNLTTQEREDFGRRHSWDARARTLLEILSS